MAHRVEYMAQIDGDVTRGLIAFVAVLCQAAVNKFLEFRRNVGSELANWFGVGMDETPQCRYRCLPIERTRARQHLIENDAEREEVGPVIDFVADGLFRGHVSHCAQRCANCRHGGLCGVCCARCCCCSFGDPEVEDLRDALGCEHDVAGLEVAVHDACGMSVCESRTDLPRDIDR